MTDFSFFWTESLDRATTKFEAESSEVKEVDTDSFFELLDMLLKLQSGQG